MPILTSCHDAVFGKQINTTTSSFYKLTTLVKNYTDPEASGVPPYARDINGQTYCDPPTTCGDYINGQPMCGIPEPSETVSSNTIQRGAYWNTYELTQSIESPCDYPPGLGGWKAVIGSKVWQGVHGYTSHDRIYLPQPTLGINIPDVFEWKGECKAQYVKPNADTVKYRSISANASFTFQEHSERYSIDRQYSANGSQAVIVDRYSGALTTLSETLTSTDGDEGKATVWEWLNEANYDWGYAIEAYWNAVSFGGNPPTYISQDTGAGSSFTVRYEDIYSKYEVIIDNVNHTLSIKGWTWWSSGDEETTPSDWYLSWDENYRANNTWYHHDLYTYTKTNGNNTDYSTATRTVDGYLGNAYSSAQVRQDAIDILAKWNLGNDKQYPWRFDETLEVPWMSYDEAYGTLQVGKAYGDPDSEPINSGLLYGEPLPYGYDKWWDYKHLNSKYCVDRHDQSYGAYSTEIYVPCATQWLSDYQALTNYQGAYEKYDKDNKIFWIQKWAERLIPRPPLNLARPCGKDKYLCDELSASCLVSNVGKVLTLATDPYIQTGQAALVLGSDAENDGIWTVTRNSSTEYELNTLLVSGSQFPSLPYKAGKISRVRWWGVPAICGNRKIDTIYAVEPVTCSFADEHYLTDGDRVNVFGALGVNGVNANNWKVKWIDKNNLALVNSSGSGNYTGGGYIQSTFGVNPIWNKDTPEGNFVLTDYVLKPRAWREIDRYSGSIVAGDEGYFQSCLLTPAPPQVNVYQEQWGLSRDVTLIGCQQGTKKNGLCGYASVLITPNSGETTANCAVYGFDSPITLDSTYGASWHCVVRQHMDDPYFQPIYPNCSGGVEASPWAEDVIGDCTGQYPHRDQFENLCQLPEGAPPIMSGTKIGCLSQTEINIPTQPIGNICAEPPYGMYIKPWVLANWQSYCVCDSGSFSTEYLANGISCQEENI